jgi:hypothetical protein
LVQQLNYDDIIDSFTNAKVRKVHFWGECYNKVLCFYCLSQNQLLATKSPDVAIEVARSRNC